MSATPGAMRAAQRIADEGNLMSETYISEVAETIDSETLAPEMLAFIERVAEWDFKGGELGRYRIAEAQKEASDLLKKVRE